MKHSFLTLGLVLICLNIFSQKMLSFQDAIIPKPKDIDTSVLNFNTKQPEFEKLSSVDKEFYYWVNYSRRNPNRFYDSVILPIVKVYPQLKGENLTSLKNDLGSKSFLPLLSLNLALEKMATEHSIDITSNNYSPSHNSSNGETFQDRFKLTHLKKCGSENISYGQNEPIFLLALLYIDLNIVDLGHRKTLLNPDLTETGINSSFYKNGYIFLVEDFACNQN